MTARRMPRRTSRKASKSELGGLVALGVIVWATALAISRLGELPTWGVLAAGMALGVLITLTGRRWTQALARRTGIQITRTRRDS